MNTWKVILATIVIFGAGVVTGGLLVHHEIMRLSPQKNVRPQQRPMQAAAQGAMRLEFLRRAQRELDLTPEQSGQIDKIIKESQERTHKLLDPIMRDQIQRARQEFLEVLTPEQRTRFQEFMKQQRELHRQAQVHSERTPEAGGGTVTNAP